MNQKDLHNQRLLREAELAVINMHTRRHFIKESAMGLGALAGQRQRKARFCDSILGVTAVDLVTGEFSAVAQVLAIAQTVAAVSARATKPRNADALSFGEALNTVGDCLDRAHYLVA